MAFQGIVPTGLLCHWPTTEAAQNVKTTAHILNIVKVYKGHYYSCDLDTQEPLNSLKLIRNWTLHVDGELAQLAFKAYSRHLWYLSEVFIAFGMFESRVTDINKRKITVTELSLWALHCALIITTITNAWIKFSHVRKSLTHCKVFCNDFCQLFISWKSVS